MREDVERLAHAAAMLGLQITDERHRTLREHHENTAAALRAVLAERDALQGQLNDLRNGWANSVKAHADALAERDALDAIASKLQHDHDMMALANGKLEAERDAAFAAGQQDMQERAADAALYLCRMKGMGERTIDGPEAAHLIRALPIKDSPDGR